MKRLWTPLPGLPLGAVGNAGGGSGGLPPFVALALALGATSYWRMATLAGNIPDIAGTNPLIPTGAPTRGVFPGGLTVGDDGSVQFAGAGDYFSAPNDPAFNMGDRFSLIMMVRSIVVPVGFEIMMSKGTDSYQLGISPGGVWFFARDNVATIANDNIAIGGDGIWHFMGLTRNGPGAGNTHVYRDGVDTTVMVSPAEVTLDTVNALQVGRDEVGDPPFPGGMDEIGLFKNIILTPAEMASLQAER